MRTLSGTLAAAVSAMGRQPAAQVRVADDKEHYSLYRHDVPAKAVDGCAAVVAADGSLIRAALFDNGGAGNADLAVQRITDPTQSAQWTTWTTLVAAGCGGNITVPNKDTAARQGAQLFYERCSGCHSLAAANAYGSKPEGQIQGGERTNGPNFNIRKEKRDDVLFAIRNGGFSGAIMPANVVVGHNAQMVADFVSKYSGGKPSQGQTNPGIKNQP